MRNLSRWSLVVGLVAVLAGPALAQVEVDYPLVTATQAEYAQGDTAVLLGYDYPPGKDLIILITRPDGKILNAAGRKGQADTVTTDAWGQFGYEYPQLNQEGFYWVDVIDAATVGKGKQKFNGDVLASTVFKDNIVNDHELVGQPLAQCGPNRPPAHGADNGGTGHGHDGLVDALACRCLVGTVDIHDTDPTASIQGFQWHYDAAKLSGHQSPGPDRTPFINQLETVDITNAGPDGDVGNSEADDGPTCTGDCWYTTAGNMVIPKGGAVTNITSQDGTNFSIEHLGEVDKGTSAKVTADRYLVTVLSDVNSARFEACHRIDCDAGDGDNGHDGRVDSSPLTGGEEVSPINICRIEDQTDPICEVMPRDDCYVDILVHDPDGLASIEILEQTNATSQFDNPVVMGNQGDIIVPTSPTDPVNIVAEKILCDEFGWFEILATNNAGLTVQCDPVDLQLVRGNGRPVIHEFTLNDREGHLFIQNHGLREVFINLNGHRLHFAVHRGTGNNAFSMEEAGPSFYDIFEFLKAGDNHIEIRAVGPPSGTARIVIHD